MACLAAVNGVFETSPLLGLVDTFHPRITVGSSKIVGFAFNRDGAGGDKVDERKPTNFSRRLALGAVSVALSLSSSGSIRPTLAEDNGLWLDGPIPIPPVYNRIANEETGTRSFLKKGVYIANVGPKGSAYRLKKYAFDLMGLGDLIGQDAWNYMNKYLRLKSTFMYYDFDTVISAAPINEKKLLTDLANRLFDSVEKLEVALKMQSLPQTESCYQDTVAILQEVKNSMGLEALKWKPSPYGMGFLKLEN